MPFFPPLLPLSSSSFQSIVERMRAADAGADSNTNVNASANPYANANADDNANAVAVWPVAQRLPK